MTTKKQTRKIQKPAKEGTIPRDVVEAAVKAVSGKATEQTKKPTIKSLQQEVANLTEQLMYANKLVLSLEEDVSWLKLETKAYEANISNKEAKIKELENRSIAAQILFKLSQPFK